MLRIIRFYRPYQPSPPPPYAQQSSVGAAFVTLTADQLVQRNKIFTIITHKLRSFLLISGFIYIIWSLAIICLEIAIALQSQWTQYRSMWTSVLLLYVGINMSIISCRIDYPMNHLIRIFTFTLLFGVFEIILSDINLNTSERCYSNDHRCDNQLVTILKITSFLLTIVATIHTVINLVVIRNEHKKSVVVLNP